MVNKRDFLKIVDLQSKQSQCSGFLSEFSVLDGSTVNTIFVSWVTFGRGPEIKFIFGNFPSFFPLRPAHQPSSTNSGTTNPEFFHESDRPDEKKLIKKQDL